MSQNPSKPLFNNRFGPIWVALLYAGFASLWIIASSIFLGFSVDDHILQGYIEVGKGLLFVVVTSSLLYLLVKMSQARIRRLTQLYAALSQCNQAIVRSTSEEDLLPQICLDTVRFGGMKMAWIGMLDPASGLIQKVAAHGEGIEYLDDIKISMQIDDQNSRGPTGTAVRENQPYWCQDFRMDPRTAPWHEYGARYGWKSSAALPLHRNGQVVGIFSIYSGEANGFDQADRDLLLEMAMDISFALDNFEREAARLKAEQALRESEVRYSTLFANNSVVMLLVDPTDGRIVDANAAAAEYYGWERASLITMNIGQINILPSAELQDAISSVLKNGRGKFHFRHRLANGQERDVEVFTGEVTIDGHALLQSCIIDVSERRQAEQQLRSAQALTQRFLDHLPGTASIKNRELQVLLASRGFQTYLGINPAGIIGKSNRQIFSAELAEKFNTDDQRVLSTGQTEIQEEEFHGRHFESIKFVIDDETQGRLLGDITIEITQRHMLAVRQQAQLEINELSVTLPEREILLRGLGIAERLTGSTVSFAYLLSEDQKTDELVTRFPWGSESINSTFALDYSGNQDGIWADSFRLRQPIICNDYANYGAAQKLHDSQARPTRVLSVPVIEDDVVRMILSVGSKETDYDAGDIVTLQLIGNDLWRIARRKRVEAELKQQLTELQALNQKLEDAHNQLVQSEKLAAIGQLAAGIAHEINNPISFIQSNFGSLTEYMDELLAIDAAYGEIESRFSAQLPQAFKQVHQIKRRVGHDFIINDLRQLIGESRGGLERVSRIVQDLKNFSRVGETDWQWVNLHHGLDSTLNIVRSLIRQEIEIECQYGQLPLVHCIPAQINQVFLNLIINAAQSIDQNGRIRISTGADELHVWVHVEDTGRGIPPENMKRLFEPFFTTKPVGKGTGLGLSLSKGIVLRHKGTIQVESESGRGSLFQVILPIDPLAEQSADKGQVLE